MYDYIYEKFLHDSVPNLQLMIAEKGVHSVLEAFERWLQDKGYLKRPEIHSFNPWNPEPDKAEIARLKKMVKEKGLHQEYEKLCPMCDTILTWSFLKGYWCPHCRTLGSQKDTHADLIKETDTNDPPLVELIHYFPSPNDTIISCYSSLFSNIIRATRNICDVTCSKCLTIINDKIKEGV